MSFLIIWKILNQKPLTRHIHKDRPNSKPSTNSRTPKVVLAKKKGGEGDENLALSNYFPNFFSEGRGGGK